ncbi:uncharacterized protein LOC111808263 [Cucurbita pepo subsp. pepo]|uniref:uncharacterized protein LOC111808263 n=1 Tax=Cucurbita pepo subsp. pepo TaxID=3664 RepID=UPI000C9D3DA1|nr:uncharacterized protein LOC111808263 [Cucurbita pepo subsp. pepo]
MGDRYNRFNPQKFRQKNMFLPMLCSKPAIKDGRLPSCDVARTESFSGDPLSPRIGCMGQVKRNNRVAGLPISHRILISTKNAVLSNKKGSNANVGYFKLKKFFSSKNLLVSPSTTGTSITRSTAAAASISTAGVNCCGSRRRPALNAAISGKKCVTENGNCDSFSVVDLDPPLPVVRRVQKAGEERGEMENLWKRRSGGIVLQSLQIQQTHLPKHRLQITSV